MPTSTAPSSDSAVKETKRRSGRVSTERLHYFNEPLSGRQVSFYSDISSSSDASTGEATPRNATAAALEAFLAPSIETQLFSTHPRNSVDHGMAELSKQMQLWSDEALSRRTTSTPSGTAGASAGLSPLSPRSLSANHAAVSSSTGAASGSAGGASGSSAAVGDQRGLVIKLSPMSSQSSLLSSASFSSTLRSPTTSFLSTDSNRWSVSGGGSSAASEAPIELVEIPPPPSISSQHPKPFKRVTIKKREGGTRAGDQVSSYDAASFRSSEEDSEPGDVAENGGAVVEEGAAAGGGQAARRGLGQVWRRVLKAPVLRGAGWTVAGVSGLGRRRRAERVEGDTH